MPISHLDKSGFLPSLPARFQPRVLSVLVPLVLSTPGVMAQDNNIESVVITTDRQETRIGDISASVFAVSEESVDTVSATHINELLTRVPGTWINRNNGQESLTSIRSPVLTGAGSCGAFQMSQDGIPLRAAGFCNVNQMFESNHEQAGRVEVVLGPGSVLYGANALHGAINVITAGVSEEFEGDVSYEAGPHSYQRVKSTVSNTAGSTGYRVNFNGASDGGYKEDSGFDQQKLDIRHVYEGDRFTFNTVLNATNLNQETAGYLQAGFEAYKDDDLKKNNPNPEAFRDAESVRLHSSIGWQADHGNWTVTPYYRKTEMDFLQHFLPGAPLEQNGQESWGLQTMFALNEGGKMDWMAGVDLEVTNAWLKESQDGPATGSAFLVATLPEGQHYDFQVDATLISPFVQYRFNIDESNRINLGVRYESLEYDYDNLMIDGRTKDDGTPCGFGGCRYARPADRSDSFSNFSGQLGWVHDFDASQQMFINVSKAFRAPQANELYRLQNDQVVADLDSEELLGFEAGYRASRDSHNYSLTAYWMDKENVIFQDNDRNNVSDGETRHQGIEFAGSFFLREDLTLSLVTNYAKHTYQANVAPRGVTIELDGKDIDTSPRLTASAQIAWQVAENHDVEFEWVKVGSYFQDDENLHEYEGHSLLNIRYRADFEQWYLGARLTNALDQDYAERADYAFGNDRYFVGEPASLYVTVGTRF